MLRKKIFLIFLILNLLTNRKIYSLDWLITNSGNYVLADDILAAGDSTNGSIRIQSSYVNLDLNGRFISQQDATASANGIQIDPGVTDVIIKNGTVRNFTGKGILVGAGCSVLSLQNINIEACQTRGIDFSGTATATGGKNITESNILNCKIINSLSGASADFALNLTNCSRVLVSDTDINRNASTSANPISIVNLQDSSQCTLRNINVSSNSSSSPVAIIGINLNSVAGVVSQNYLSNCFVRNNSSTATSGTNTLYGIALQSAVSNSFNVFDNCQILNNTASSTGTGASVFYGIYLNSVRVSANVFRGCVIDGNTSSSATAGSNMYGLRIAGPNNVFTDCEIIRNVDSTTTGGSCQGIELDSNANGNVLIRCASSYNQETGAASTCIGLYFPAASSANFNEIKECEFLGNNATTNALSFGIDRVGTGANNLFTRNIAFNNGPTSPVTAANQANGVTSISGTTSTTLLNTPGQPWTNFGIVS